jgi:hypothetical protein
MAEGDEIAAYEAWLRQYVKLAETGRKLASGLADGARRRASKINEHRFSSHAQRLYNEEVYWTLQIQGVASLAAQQSAAPAEPAPAKKTAKARAAAPSGRAKGPRS